MTARNVQTAIVLQGGGALGAYEYGVLKALYESRPGFRPVAVAGISIGGDHRRGARRCRGRPDPRAGHAVAAQAHRRVPGARAVAPAPIDRALATFGNPGCTAAGRAVHPPWLLTSIYDTAPLRGRSPSSSTRDGSTTTPRA
jgi:hypothetical protein